MIKTIPQAIDDMAVSLGASPSAEIPTVAQALENLYTALGGTRTDLDTLVLPEVIDLVAPLIQGGGGGSGVTFPTFNFSIDATTHNPVWSTTSTYAEVKSIYNEHGLDDAIPYIFNNSITGFSSWAICSFLNDLTGLDFPPGVNEGFVLTINTSSADETLFANDGNFYSENGGGSQ